MADRIGRMEKGFSDLHADVREIERRVDKIKQNRLADPFNMPEEARSRSVRPESSTSRGSRCRKARRSLRMRPIKWDSGEMRVALMHFLAQKLRLGEDALMDANDCNVRRVPRTNNFKTLHEVFVGFPAENYYGFLKKVQTHRKRKTTCTKKKRTHRKKKNLQEEKAMVQSQFTS